MTRTSTQLDAILGENLSPGICSAAAVRDGELIDCWHGPDQPLLPIYSLTKTYIAALALETVRAGRVRLDAGVSGFCPDLPDADRISLRQLLNHTAGLRDYGSLKGYQQAVAAGAPVWPDQEFADQTYRRGGLFEPGAGWSYSNPGYALVVRILEGVCRQPLDRQLDELICQPLDLRRTRFADTLNHPDICPASSRFLDRAAAPRPVKSHYDPGWVWHRLIVSDAADSARFLDALLHQRRLGSTLTEALTELTPVGGEHPPWTAPSYGLGLMGEPHGRRGPMFGHNGGGPGYSASAYYFASTGTSVAVLAATEDTDGVLGATLALHDRLTSTRPRSGAP